MSAPASSSSSSSSAAFVADDAAMADEEYIAPDEAAQVIAADGVDGEGDDVGMEDMAAAVEEEEAQLTEEERRARDEQLHKAATMATELREMLDEDDSKQGFFDHKDSVFCVRICGQNPNLVLSGDGDDQAFLWDAASGNRMFHLAGHTDSVIDGGFSSDGRLVATASMDATVRVYHTHDGTLKHKLEGPAKEVEFMAWHPAGPVIAAGSGDETVWMWNAESGECMSVFSGHSGAVNCGAWTADGKHLITCGESGDLIMWNPKTGEAAIHLKDVHDGPITSFALHPDKSQKLCMTGGADGMVKLLSYDNGRTLAHFKDLHADSVEGVAFAEKHKLAATCSVDGKIKILDLTTSFVRLTCAHEDAVTHIEWAPNGEPLLFSSSVDKTVRLWDARSGQCVQTWKGHSDAVMTFAVSPDASTVISGADDNTALVFKR